MNLVVRVPGSGLAVKSGQGGGGHATGCGSPISRSKIGDPQGISLLPFCSASKWHEDVP